MQNALMLLTISLTHHVTLSYSTGHFSIPCVHDSLKEDLSCLASATHKTRQTRPATDVISCDLGPSLTGHLLLLIFQQGEEENGEQLVSLCCGHLNPSTKSRKKYRPPALTSEPSQAPLVCL
ncbi:adhesion G-protein coupled receptor D2 [Tachysurus ichikawai]